MRFDHRRVCSLTPVQGLYEQARRVLDRPTDPAALASLRGALEAVERAADESDGLATVKERARDLYAHEAGDTEVQVDDSFAHHNGTDGFWVMGWLWVPGEE